MDETSSKNNTPKICGLCEKNSSKYCCPRCEVYYCSLDCYKSERHVDCSEDFYRRCVSEEMAGNITDQESRHKMMEMLQRDRSSWNVEAIPRSDEEVDSDDENCIDLHERVKNLDLDDADALWDVLTQDERNEFEAMLNSSNVDSLIPQWEPWWSYRKKNKLIEDANHVDNAESTHLSKCPALVEVPQFSSIAFSKPSPQIKYNITNCIAAYALVMRYLNGEINSMLHIEAATCMYALCDNLNKKQNFFDEEASVGSVVQNCQQSNLLITDANSSEVMRQDVSDITQGPSKEQPSLYTKCALSHMHNIFNEARKTLKSGTKTNVKKRSGFSLRWPDLSIDQLQSDINMDADKLKLAIKKIEYYLSYLNSNYSHYLFDDR